jgi:hypothetical protein
MRKVRLYYLLFLVIVYSGIANGSPILKFHNDKFKIVQFTDLHWIENSEYQKENDSTLLLMHDIIQVEKPDLVIFTGDIVVSKGAAVAWRKITQLMTETEVPFAVTFGNHDAETDLSKKQMLNIIQSNPYNLTYNGDSTIHGVGNCTLPIKSEDGTSNKWIIYLFDSNSYTHDSTLGYYDWIRGNQIFWYRRQSNKYTEEQGHPLPSLVFFHIPFPEFNRLRKTGHILGNCDEGVSSPVINSGLFAAFVEMKDVFGVFVGHDHNNDYIGKLHNIWLAYGRKTGYHAAYKELLQRGARVIVVYENERKFDTYIRTLDSTYFLKDCH